MDLFGNTSFNNLLPFDGTVRYFGKVMNRTAADHYLKLLLQHIDWKNDEAILYGKHYITKRKAAWYGDRDYAYRYSGTTKYALPWTAELLELKKLAETHTGFHYNSCLLNLYHDGNEGMAWHSDDEKTLEKNAAIASVSLGAERNFSFKHKVNGHKVSLHLEHGSLLVMADETQTNWLHRLPPATKVTKPRVNLTFRKILV